MANQFVTTTYRSKEGEEHTVSVAMPESIDSKDKENLFSAIKRTMPGRVVKQTPQPVECKSDIKID
jgi:hypothetical protein